MPTKSQKIFIAIPAYRGIVCPQFLDSLEATTQKLKELGIDFEIHIQQGNCYIQMARNNLAEKFMQSESTTMVFLDDDISWEPEAFVELINSPYDVTAGVYPLKTKKLQFPVLFNCDKDGVPLCDHNGYISSAGVPTGFLAIKRKVFEDIKNANPHLAFKDLNRETLELEEGFDWFPQGVRDGRWVGEDFAFCRLWTDLGGVIAIIPDIDFCHHSTDTTYKGNLLKWLRSQPGGSNEEKCVAGDDKNSSSRAAES